MAFWASERARSRGTEASGSRATRDSVSSVSSTLLRRANRPWGRTRSVRNKMANTTASGDPGVCPHTLRVRLSATPMTSPPTMAPGKLVSPPMIAAVKARRRNTVRNAGAMSCRVQPRNRPDMAANAPATVQVMASIRPGLRPTMRAAVALSAEARIMRPTFVRSIKYHRPPHVITTAAMMRSCTCDT